MDWGLSPAHTWAVRSVTVLDFIHSVLSSFPRRNFFILLGKMDRIHSILVCTFSLSMVNESFRPANATAIAHYSHAGNRTQAFSLVRLAINMGWGIGSALGAYLPPSIITGYSGRTGAPISWHPSCFCYYCHGFGRVIFMPGNQDW